MKSETDVRYEGIELTLTTHLIVYHSITNTPNQTTECICILGIGKESLNSPLVFQHNEFLDNFF